MTSFMRMFPIEGRLTTTFYALVLCCLILSWMAVVGNGQRVLTTSSFEHTTQAATGQTTGIWVVRFCESENEKCNHMNALWSDFAERMLEEQIFAADVDVSKHTAVAKRFDVRSPEVLPAFLMLRRGTMYRKWAVEDLESIEQWVMQGWQQETPEAVPPEDNQFAVNVNVIVDGIVNGIQRAIDASSMYFHENLGQAGIRWWIVAAVGLLLSLSSLLLFMVIYVRLIQRNSARSSETSKKRE